MGWGALDHTSDATASLCVCQVSHTCTYALCKFCMHTCVCKRDARGGNNIMYTVLRVLCKIFFTEGGSIACSSMSRLWGLWV